MALEIHRGLLYYYTSEEIKLFSKAAGFTNMIYE